MKNTEPIFSFETEKEKKWLWLILTALATAASASAICLAVLQSVDGIGRMLYILIPLATVTAEMICCRSNKVFSALNILLGIAFLALVIGGRQDFLSGGAMWLNRIFKASEESQSYIYQMLPVSVEASRQAFAETYFLCVSQLGLTASLAFYCFKKIPFLPIVILFILALSQQYFGVAPAPLYNVAMFLSLLCLTFASAHRGTTVHGKTLRQSVLCLFLVFSLLLAGTYFAYPKKYHVSNPYVEKINEKIRDYLDHNEEDAPEDTAGDGEDSASKNEEKEREDKSDEERKEEPEPVQEVPDENEEPQEPENSNTEEGSAGDSQAIEGESGSEGVSSQQQEEPEPVNWSLLFLILLPVLLLLTYLFFLLRAAYKRNKGMNDENNNRLVQFTFAQSIRWMRQGKFPKNNVPLSRLTEKAESLFGADYAAEYSKAVARWQESLYRPQVMPEDSREEALAFYKLTKKTVWHKVNILKRLKIKLVKFL